MRLWNGNQRRKDKTNDQQQKLHIRFINGHKLEYVDKFKYLGAIVSEKGSRPEILSKIALTIAALTKFS